MERGAIQPPKEKSRKRWLIYGVLVVIFILLAAVAVPNFVKASVTECKNACINNLRQIDGAKQQWAIEHQKPPGYVLTPDDELQIAAYIKGGRPICPAGGHYSYQPVGDVPTCDKIEGGLVHALVNARP